VARLGEAWVEVEGDYRELVREGGAAISRAFDRIADDADLSALGDAVGAEGRRGADRFVRDANGRLRSSRGQFVRTGEQIGRSVGQGFNDGMRRSSSGGGRGLFGGILDDAERFLSSGFDQLFGRLTAKLTPGRLLAGTATGLASLAAKLVIFGGAAGLIVPAVNALVGLTGVLTVLPGILGAVIAPVGATAVAFIGMADAIEAIRSGDVEKINEALKDLGPNARASAFELAKIPDLLKPIRQLIQESFFGELQGDFRRFVDDLDHVFGGGLARIATLVGGLIDQLLEKLGSPAGQDFFARILELGARFVEEVGPPLLELLAAFGNMFLQTLPTAESLFTTIGNGLQRFADFIDTKVASGEFQGFLDYSKEVAGELFGIVGELVELFGVMFAQTDKEGSKFLGHIRKALEGLNQFLRSKDGKDALIALTTLAKILGATILASVNAALLFLSVLTKVAREARNAFNWVQRLQRSVPGGSIFGGSIFNLLAEGGIVTRPTRAIIGEEGPEVVVPLTKPRRARQLMQESGLVSIAQGMVPGGGDTFVTVFLGDREITDILDTRVERGLSRAGRAVDQGVRPD